MLLPSTVLLFILHPQDPPHSQFLFLTLLPLLSPRPLLRILVTYFCVSFSSSFLMDPLFRLFFLSHLVLGLSPLGIVSVCFWALSRYQKTVNSPQHRRGDGRETNRVYVLFTLGLFLQSLIFHSLYISHFILSNFKSGFHGANEVFW